MTKFVPTRAVATAAVALSLTAAASAAFAQAAAQPARIDGADTAWMIVATGRPCLMAGWNIQP